jgi:ribosomal protein L40E
MILHDEREKKNMFCEKCGAQLPDTAGFCNKCGNALRKNGNQTQVMKPRTLAVDRSQTVLVSEKKKTGVPKLLPGILMLAAVILLAVIAVAVFSGIKKETSIYGTWVDAGKTISFTFQEDGTLRVAGANNVLGADAFQFTKEDGELHLQTQGLVNIGLDLPYEISDDTLQINVMGQKMTLYRTENAEDIESVLKNLAGDVVDAVQGNSIYGTWSDSTGAISFTFQEDGKLKISGMQNYLDVEAFIFTEVDDHTLQLKADTDNAIIGAVGMNMEYEIDGNVMTVSIMNQELKLIKDE